MKTHFIVRAIKNKYTKSSRTDRTDSTENHFWRVCVNLDTSFITLIFVYKIINKMFEIIIVLMIFNILILIIEMYPVMTTGKYLPSHRASQFVAPLCYNYVFWLSVCLYVPFSWSHYLKNRLIEWITAKLGSCMYLAEPMNRLDFGVTRSKVTWLIMYAKIACDSVNSIQFIKGLVIWRSGSRSWIAGHLYKVKTSWYLKYTEHYTCWHKNKIKYI